MNKQEHKLIVDLYKHYKSVTELSDDEINLIYNKHGKIRDILKNLIQEFEPDAIITEEYLDEKLRAYQISEEDNLNSDLNEVLTIDDKAPIKGKTKILFISIIIFFALGIIVFVLFNEKISASKKYTFETIKDSVTHTCYYYKSEFPNIKVSESNDPNIEYINNLIRDCSFRIPAIMSNENYKNFRECKAGSYNNQKSLHNLHVTNQDCEWCKSEFYSKVLLIEQKKYFSILMQVEYTAGGNWGSLGFNSLILKDGKVITIPDNESVKKTLIEDIKEYQSKNKLVDNDENNYSLLNEISNWGIDDITFYFKNDSLMLIFNGGYYLQNQNFDIPLPKLQLLLTL